MTELHITRNGEDGNIRIDCGEYSAGIIWLPAGPEIRTYHGGDGDARTIEEALQFVSVYLKAIEILQNVDVITRAGVRVPSGKE